MLYRLWERWADDDPSRIALETVERIWTYKDLALAVRGYQALLAETRPAPGDVAVICLPNSPAFVFAYYAASAAGLVVVPVHFDLTRYELAGILRDCRPRMLVTCDRKSGVATQAVDESSNQCAVIIVDKASAAGSRSDPQPTVRPAAEGHRLDPAVVLYTSGTTGLPRGATFSSEAVRHNVAAVADAIGIGPGDRVLVFLSLHHSYSQNVGMNTALMHGATLHLCDGFDVRQVREHLERGVTHFLAVPSVYEALLRLPPSAVDFSRVSTFFSAGDHLPATLNRDWVAHVGTGIRHGYGLTECGLVACTWQPVFEDGAVGRPLRGVEVVIEDESGEGLGNIAVRSPSNMLGYWPERIDSGWVHTGDVGRLDDDGCLSITGRVKSVIKVDGRSVYPEEVELVLRTHPAVHDAYVYGTRYRRGSDLVTADVVLRSDRSADAAALRAHCAASLADNKVPVRIVFLDSLTRSATGKLRRHVAPD